MSLILDLFISTYTDMQSFLFLNILNQKNVYYVLFVSLIIDFIISKTYGLITLILLFLFYINVYFNNFYIKNIFNYVFVILILNFNFSIVGFLIHFIFISLNRYHIIKW